MNSVYFAAVGLGWVLLIALTVRHARRSKLGSCGLTVAYALMFLLIHMGGFLYILPWYDPSWNWYLVSTGVTRDSVGKGFTMSLLGMCGYYCGLHVYQVLFRGPENFRSNPHLQLNAIDTRRHALILLVYGMIFYVVLRPISHMIPSGGAIVTAGMALATVGASLFSYLWLTNQAATTRAASTVLLLGIPFIILLLSGFLSYGVAAFIAVISFNAPYIRLRPIHGVLIAFIFWLGLSFFVTYMDVRSELRLHVLSEGDVVSRFMSTFLEMINGAQLFNPTNEMHLGYIDGRLNQNSFVGLAVDYIAGRHIDFAHGRTIWFALVAWIPRALWPGKPEFGGSGTLVMDYTGLELSRTSSFGVGQILEFYFNFGSAGVFVGMLILGIAIRYVDVKAAQKLQQSDLRRFSGWFLIGICMIQPQGVLSEVVASAAAGVLIMYGMNFIRTKTFTDSLSRRTNATS